MLVGFRRVLLGSLRTFLSAVFQAFAGSMSSAATYGHQHDTKYDWQDIFFYADTMTQYAVGPKSQQWYGEGPKGCSDRTEGHEPAEGHLADSGNERCESAQDRHKTG